MAHIEEEHPLASLDQYMDHIQHMVQVAGIDHVGIASDMDGGGGITGWMDASQTPNVTAALRARGFSEADIAKIWSGNLLRVWQAAIDEAAARARSRAVNTRLAAALVLLLCTGTATAARRPPTRPPRRERPPTPRSRPASTAQAIDAAVEATIARYRCPGIAVGVVEDGKVVFARAQGDASPVRR